MASIAVIVLCITIIITCNGVASKPTEKYLTTRLLDVLNPPETIFPESNKGTTLSSSGKKVDHVDYERKRRHAFFQDSTNTATATDDKDTIRRLSFNICCYCLCCPCKW